MADEPVLSIDRLPTLTEVLELGRDGVAPAPVADAACAHETQAVEASTPAPSPLQIAEPPADARPDLVGLLLEELQPRLGLMLEARLREAMAPALARAADGLIRELREELSVTLRELVEESVAALDRKAGS